MSGYARQRARDRIADVAGRGLDLATLWRECGEILQPVLPCWDGPCWFTIDPSSGLVTSHFQSGMDRLPDEWLAQEYYEDDVNKLADVARDGAVTTLHEATAGDPRRSHRYRHMIVPNGGEQELLAGLRTSGGQAWGVLGLYRERGQPQFEPEDLAFVRSLTPHLAEGARRALLVGEAKCSEGPEAPALLVFGDGWELDATSPGAQRLLADLPPGPAPDDVLPDRAPRNGRVAPCVYAVAGRARRLAGAATSSEEAATARVQGRSGRWIELHGLSMDVDGRPRAAVIIEPARSSRLAPLLMDAYELTDREQDVTRLVLQGCSTADIADRLFISPHTVQQHLKGVFAKTGVRSRRDLVGKVFFAHYEPRVRDNEQRVIDGEPVLGGPFRP